MLHFCSQRDAANVGALLLRLYAQAHAIMTEAGTFLDSRGWSLGETTP